MTNSRNDCHTPTNIIEKYYTQGDHGFWRSDHVRVQQLAKDVASSLPLPCLQSSALLSQVAETVLRLRPSMPVEVVIKMLKNYQF
jgi:hypothetical protein